MKSEKTKKNLEHQLIKYKYLKKMRRIRKRENFEKMAFI